MIKYSGEQLGAIDLMKRFLKGEFPGEYEFSLIGAAGTGKAQPLSSKIYTPDGYKLMGDIKVNDVVLTPAGGITKVVGVFPQGIKDVYELTFSDGSKVQASGDHLWSTLHAHSRGRSNKYQIRTTKEILTTINRSDGRIRNHSIPLTIANFNAKPTTFDPYLMGLYLSEGSSRSGMMSITTSEPKIVNYLMSNYDVWFDGRYTYRLKGGTVGKTKTKYRVHLEDCNLWNKKSHLKFIPKDYLINSLESRIKLLQGLMDGDGEIDKRTGSVYYHTTSPELRDDVIFLISSLGGSVHNVIERFPKGANHLSYSISFRLPNDISPFKLSKRLYYLKPKTKYKAVKYIDSIKLIGREEVQCIAVEDSEHLYVTDGLIATHNTTILKEVVKEYARDMVFGATVSHAAKNVLNDSAGDWMKCYTLAAVLGLKPSVDVRSGKMRFVRDKNQKGAPPVTEAKILIIDECSMVDEDMQEQIREAIMEGTYIIYSGDRFQLPPVDESEEDAVDSPTFNCKLRAELTIPMRFDEIIGETASFYRETINIYDQYKGINAESFNTWRPTKNNGKSTIEYTSDYTYFINKAMNHFYHDMENTRMLAYRNSTITEMNDFIRGQFYPHHDDQYITGEYIITNKPFKDSIHNGEIFYISDVNIGVAYAPNMVSKDGVRGYEAGVVPIKVYNIEVKRHKEDENAVDELVVVHQDSLGLYTQIKNELITIAKENRNFWYKYYQFQDTFADISRAFCMSSHKSQGQSISHVFVLANDILSVQKTNLKTKLQSLYVATTRARTNLTIFM